MRTELKLKASDVMGVQEFGSAVAVSGDYAIVGARHGGFDPGAAYVFVKNGAAWMEQAKLSASDTTAFDQFGGAVGIDGDYAIVGASQAGIGSCGQAYIFHRDGSAWVEDTILFAHGETGYSLFGQSVSISGNWAIVGSDKAAHMFQRTGSTWTEKAKLREYRALLESLLRASLPRHENPRFCEVPIFGMQHQNMFIGSC